MNMSKYKLSFLFPSILGDNQNEKFFEKEIPSPIPYTFFFSEKIFVFDKATHNPNYLSALSQSAVLTSHLNIM